MIVALGVLEGPIVGLARRAGLRSRWPAGCGSVRLRPLGPGEGERA